MEKPKKPKLSNDELLASRLNQEHQKGMKDSSNPSSRRHLSNLANIRKKI